MRKVLKFLGWIFVGFVVIIGVVAAIAYTYEDELKARAMQELQDGLLTDMNVGSIDYSVFKYFPNAALECKNVVLYDTFQNSDTLVSAGSVSFEIGLMSLLRGKIAFDQVRVSDGKIALRRNEKGEDNFHFWKASEADSKPGESTAFDLEIIRLRNVYFLYDDRLSDVFVETRIKSADVGGTITEDHIGFGGEIDAQTVKVKTDGDTWVDNAPIKGSLTGQLDLVQSRYAFEKLDLELAGVRILGDLVVATQSEGVDLRLSADVKSIDFAAVIDLLPTIVREKLADYELSGRGSGSILLTGLAGAGHTPSWDVQLDIRKAAARHKKHRAEIKGIDTHVRASGGGIDPGALFIDRFSGYLEGGRIEINGSMKDFNSPTALLDLRADVRLEDLRDLLDLESVGVMRGRLAIEAGFAGILPFREKEGEKRFDPAMLGQNRYNGEAELTDVSIGLNGMPRPVEGINGKLRLTGDRAEVDALSMTVGRSDMTISGSIANILPWLLSEDETLRVDAKCTSNRIDVASFIMESEKSNSEDEYHFALPDDIDLRLDARIGEFTFRAFSAKTLKGAIELNKHGLRFNQVSFASAGGQSTLSFAVQPSKGNFTVAASGLMTGIDIRQLFIQFEDFGQDFLTSAHLKGRCRVDAAFTATMAPNLAIDPKSIVSSIDLVVENGELIGLQSMKHISDYMRGNKLISPFVKADLLEEKLSHIKFETLDNRIEIKNERIYFPMMDIRSSAMDIKASGSHWFDNRIDYSVGLYLRDILMRNDRADFGEVEDDGLGHRFFLSMTGSTDSPAFGYDRLARKEVRKQERAEERETLRRIIKEDLNPFKKKEKSAVEEPKKPASNISVNWGDEEKEKQPTETAVSEPKEEPKKRRWRIFNEEDDEEEKVAPPPLEDEDF